MEGSVFSLCGCQIRTYLSIGSLNQMHALFASVSPQFLAGSNHPLVSVVERFYQTIALGACMGEFQRYMAVVCIHENSVKKKCFVDHLHIQFLVISEVVGNLGRQGHQAVVVPLRNTGCGSTDGAVSTLVI